MRGGEWWQPEGPHLKAACLRASSFSVSAGSLPEDATPPVCTCAVGGLGSLSNLVTEAASIACACKATTNIELCMTRREGREGGMRHDCSRGEQTTSKHLLGDHQSEESGSVLHSADSAYSLLPGWHPGLALCCSMQGFCVPGMHLVKRGATAR